MTNYKIFGWNVSIGKKPASKQQTITKGEKRRAREVINRQYKRNTSFEIDSITQALQLAESPDNPDRSLLHDIYRYILRDGHLLGQIQNVMKPKVLSEPWVLYRNGQPDDAATELYNKRWMNQLIEYQLESILHGYSVVELDELDPKKANVAVVELLPREHVSIERRWILIDGTINGSYLPYAEYADELNLIEFGKQDDFGLLLPCAYNIIWKLYSRSDWSRASEKFGMPILRIKTSSTNDAVLDELEQRAANFGTDGYIIVGEEDDAEIVERSGQNLHLIYKDKITLCDEQISKLINGGTAASDTKAFTGSAEVQERTLEDISSMRMQGVVDEMNERVLPFLAAKGFAVDGLRFDYPTLRRAREKRKKGQQLATDATKTEQQKQDQPPTE